MVACPQPVRFGLAHRGAVTAGIGFTALTSDADYGICGLHSGFERYRGSR